MKKLEIILKYEKSKIRKSGYVLNSLKLLKISFFDKHNRFVCPFK